MRAVRWRHADPASARYANAAPCTVQVSVQKNDNGPKKREKKKTGQTLNSNRHTVTANQRQRASASLRAHT